MDNFRPCNSEGFPERKSRPGRFTRPGLSVVRIKGSLKTAGKRSGQN
jgi:hypothetical protein